MWRVRETDAHPTHSNVSPADPEKALGWMVVSWWLPVRILQEESTEKQREEREGQAERQRQTRHETERGKGGGKERKKQRTEIKNERTKENQENVRRKMASCRNWRTSVRKNVSKEERRRLLY